MRIQLCFAFWAKQLLYFNNHRTWLCNCKNSRGQKNANTHICNKETSVQLLKLILSNSYRITRVFHDLRLLQLWKVVDTTYSPFPFTLLSHVIATWFCFIVIIINGVLLSFVFAFLGSAPNSPLLATFVSNDSILHHFCSKSWAVGFRQWNDVFVTSFHIMKHCNHRHSSILIFFSVCVYSPSLPRCLSSCHWLEVFLSYTFKCAKLLSFQSVYGT